MFNIDLFLTNKVFMVFCLAVVMGVMAVILILCIYCMCQRSKKRRYMQRVQKEQYLNNALMNDMWRTQSHFDVEDDHMFDFRDGIWLSFQSNNTCFRERVDIRIPIVIGRGSDCDIRCSDTSVSTRHCQIFLVDNSIYARDMGSKNHTIIESGYGRTVLGENQRAEIFFGSVIRLGNTTVTVSN